MFKTLKEIWQSVDISQRRYLSLALFIIGILGFVSIFILPWIFTLPAKADWMTYGANESNVANTINGIAAPFIAIASAILTFLAFWVQYQANIQQKQQFDKQIDNQKKGDQEREKIWRIERFENRFYELLRMHKSNVEEMNISDRLHGRKCFVHMFYELRYCYKSIQKILEANYQADSQKENFQALPLAYRIFFFGIGVSSEKNYVPSLDMFEKEIFLEVKKHLEDIQNKYVSFVADNANSNYFTYNSPLLNPKDDDTIEFYYFPYDGHANRLAHYYRHLFQTCNFVVGQDILNENEKYSYIKTLRAQLSNFEQLMLYYNSLAWFKDQWKELFIKYRLIKNLPIPMADFDIKPHDYFVKDIEKLPKNKDVQMFEWDEKN